MSRRDRNTTASLLASMLRDRRAGNDEAANFTEKLFKQQIAANKRQRKPLRGRPGVTT